MLNRLRTTGMIAIAALAATSAIAAAQSFDYRYTKQMPAEESSWPPKAP